MEKFIKLDYESNFLGNFKSSGQTGYITGIENAILVEKNKIEESSNYIKDSFIEDIFASTIQKKVFYAQFHSKQTKNNNNIFTCKYIFTIC